MNSANRHSSEPFQKETAAAEEVLSAFVEMKQILDTELLDFQLSTCVAPLYICVLLWVYLWVCDEAVCVCVCVCDCGRVCDCRRVW